MNKTKFRLPVVATGALATLAFGSTAIAQSSDAIIDKLVEKGILTTKEANELREEADKNFTTSYQVKSGMLDWVTALRFNGDFRGRAEGFYSEAPNFADRSRFRYRLRFGATAVIKDNFEVGLRLSSSEAQGTFGGDPISGNTTFQDNASKKFVFIDLAYAKWTPINTPDWSASLTIGKMENPFVFSDMVFDGDYTAEGAAIQLGYTFNDQHAAKVNAGGFSLDEIGGSADDPYLFGAQLRLESTWNKHVATSIGVAALGIMNDQQLNNTAVPNINRGNTRSTLIVGTTTNQVPAFNLNPIVADASVTYTMESFWNYNAPFPIKVGGDYMYNPAATGKNRAYSAGVTFGKSGKKGLWDLAYTYKHLGADAWYEEFVDSDFGAFYGGTLVNSGLGAGYGSGTNVKGHIAKFSYSPYDSLTLSIKWFLADLITPLAGVDEYKMNRMQVDAVWKF
ncbi:MAG TPA: putative porin [Verrucomicrobiae bacterium]|nr:putative porin [Verrucomicrobiae bacterium]